LADFVYTERLNLNKKQEGESSTNFIRLHCSVHKEAEIRKEKFSFILIFLVATTFFTWAQLTAQNVPIKFRGAQPASKN
jgi:hypothetical protein